MEENIYESSLSKPERATLFQQQTINVLNENIMYDFSNVFKSIFLTFYDDEYSQRISTQIQLKHYESFIELRTKLDENLRNYYGFLDDTILHHLIIITKNISFPFEKNNFYEDEFEFPRIAEGKLFEIKNNWTANEYFLEDKLIITVELLNLALMLLCDVINADYGDMISITS